MLLQHPCLWPKHPHLCGAGLGEGGHHHLARGSGGGGNHGGQDGRHHPTSFQSVKLDQEEDEEKAHANHLDKADVHNRPIALKTGVVITDDRRCDDPGDW